MLPNKWVARLTASHSAVHNDMMATDPEEWLSLTDDRTPCPYMRGLAHNWAFPTPVSTNPAGMTGSWNFPLPRCTPWQRATQAA